MLQTKDTIVSFTDSTSHSLSDEEKKSARIMFEYCCQDVVPFLQKDELKQAVEFFVAQQEELQDATKTYMGKLLSQIPNGQTSFPQFMKMIQLIKICNEGFKPKQEIALDKKYIMRHLCKSQIIHIDACWGSLDKKKLGYLQKAIVTKCVDSVLQRYDLSGMKVSQSSNQLSKNFTTFNNYSQKSLMPLDTSQKEFPQSKDQREPLAREGSLQSSNQNTQKYSRSSQVLLKSASCDSTSLKKQLSVAFSNQPTPKRTISNQHESFGNPQIPSAFKHTYSMGQLNNIENTPFRSSSIKRAETSKSNNLTQQPKTLQRKSTLFSKGTYNPCQIQQVVDWLDKIEDKRLVSFGQFANFMCQLISANKLKFFQKVQCHCHIF